MIAWAKSSLGKNFQSICVEDKETVMPDGTTKILLSSKGQLDDVTPDMKAFLEYVDGIRGNDEFVREIDREIREIKKQESERVAYMTYAMKIQEERDEAKKEGRIENIQSNVRSLMQKKGWGLEETLDILDVSPEDRKLISTQI